MTRGANIHQMAHGETNNFGNSSTKIPQLTLVHGIDNERNGHRKQNDTINLRKWVLIFCKGQNSNGSSSQHDRKVHPRQEGSFIGEENLGFHLDRSLSGLDHVSSISTLLTACCFATLKQTGKKSTTIWCGGCCRLCWSIFASFLCGVRLTTTC